MTNLFIRSSYGIFGVTKTSSDDVHNSVDSIVGL